MIVSSMRNDTSGRAVASNGCRRAPPPAQNEMTGRVSRSPWLYRKFIAESSGHGGNLATPQKLILEPLAFIPGLFLQPNL